MWDVKGNCAKGRSKEALQINRELDNIKAQIIKHYQHLPDRKAFVTAEMVRNSYQGFDSEYETLLSAFDKDIANQKKRVGFLRVIPVSFLYVIQRSICRYSRLIVQPSGHGALIQHILVINCWNESR